MSTIRWFQIASIILALGATASGAGLIVQIRKASEDDRAQGNLQASRRHDSPVHEVAPGKLKVALTERGFVEASRNEDAYCPVDGSTTIIRIVPEGRHVKKGDIVCELDSTRLKEELANLVIMKNRAEADYQNAKRVRAAAELAVSHNIATIYQRELDRLNDAIAAARSAIRAAEDRLARTQRARNRFRRTRADSTSAPNRAAPASSDILAELEIDDRIEATAGDLKRQQAALEAAKSQRDLIAKHRSETMTKGLDVDVARKHLAELAKQAALELDARRIKKLQERIAACTVVAPIDGPVLYANDPTSAWRNKPAIEEGATVRDRQKIFSIPDLRGSMQVLTKVPESMVDRLALGLPASIKVDAFPNESLAGSVSSVAPLPDASSFLDRDRKVYSTRVRLVAPPASLRPGMTARVEILIADLENVLSVPTRAVLRRDRRFEVAVKAKDGQFDWREVTLGLGNDQSVEIKQGVEQGDRVALNPLALLSDEERRQVTAYRGSTTEPRQPGTTSGNAERPRNIADPKNEHSDLPR
jgi:RND family efflux transporter MFP subunit